VVGRSAGSWQLALTASGDLASVELTDLAGPSDKTRKNGTVHPVPHATRTVSVAPCIGADDIQYVLGWCDENAKPARVEKCHAAFINLTKAWAVSIHGVPETWCQLTTGSGGSQGFPSMTARMASSAAVPWAAAEWR
jgi:hypothetical protein